jgi:hypothetical protein
VLNLVLLGYFTGFGGYILKQFQHSIAVWLNPVLDTRIEPKSTTNSGGCREDCSSRWLDTIQFSGFQLVGTFCTKATSPRILQGSQGTSLTISVEQFMLDSTLKCKVC